jgi:hypothetical protein
MARGEDTSKHPNRGVARQAFMMMGADMDYFQNRAQDNAPAGGIPRPKMHSCGSCGEMTPTSSGTCADCK